MPFGGYKDFVACVAANQDKTNPEGYCAALHKQIIGEWPSEAATKEAAFAFVEELLDALPDKQDLALKQVEHIIRAFTRWAGVDPGNFTRCVRILKGKEGITNPEALCAWLHHEATGRWPAQKSAGPALEGPIVHKNATKRIIVGPVLVPGERDHEGEELTAQKIESVAYDFMEHFRYIDVSHTLKQSGVPVSSDLLRFPEEHVIDGEEVEVPIGTWMLGVKVAEETWPRVESGELVGFSVMGAKREDVEAYMATKSAGMMGTHFDGTKYRKTLLEDLGPDWVGVTVSILSNPSVFKSRFIAVKEGKSWVEKIFHSIKNLTKEDQDMPLTDEEKQEFKDEIKSEVSEAVKAAIPEIATAVKEMSQVDPPPDGDTDDGDTGDKGAEEITALKGELTTLKEKQTETEGALEKIGEFLEGAVKSQALPSEGDDGGDSGYPEIKRDLAGRAVR